jgi:hypothetical protein
MKILDSLLGASKESTMQVQQTVHTVKCLVYGNT